MDDSIPEKQQSVKSVESVAAFVFLFMRMRDGSENKTLRLCVLASLRFL